MLQDFRNFFPLMTVEKGSSGSSVINWHLSSCNYEQALFLTHTLRPETLSCRPSAILQCREFIFSCWRRPPVSHSLTSLWLNVFWEITHRSPDSAALTLEFFFFFSHRCSSAYFYFLLLVYIFAFQRECTCSEVFFLLFFYWHSIWNTYRLLKAVNGFPLMFYS